MSLEFDTGIPATPEQDAAANAYVAAGSLDAETAIVLWGALAERAESGPFKQLCIDSLTLLKEMQKCCFDTIQM